MISIARASLNIFNTFYKCFSIGVLCDTINPGTSIFKNSANGKQTFVIQAEKVPNAAGVRRVLAILGGPQVAFGELVANGQLKAGWIVGGYLSEWVGKATLPKGFKVGSVRAGRATRRRKGIRD